MPKGDTIGRYDSSLDKFSLNTPSRPSPLPKFSPNTQKDTLSVAKNSVGKQPTITAKPSGTAVHTPVIARAGKFVFLAVALPPYLLFYTLPKWVIQQAIPFLLDPLATVYQYTLQHFSKVYQLIHQTVSQVFRAVNKRINWALKGLKDISTSVYNPIRKKTTQGYNFLKKQHQSFRTFLLAPLKTTKAALFSLWKRFSSFLRCLYKKIISFFLRLIETLYAPLKKLINRTIDGIAQLKRSILSRIEVLKSHITLLRKLPQNLYMKALSVPHVLFAKLPLARPSFKTIVNFFQIKAKAARHTFATIKNKYQNTQVRAKAFLLSIHNRIQDALMFFKHYFKDLYRQPKSFKEESVKWIYRALPIIPIFLIITKWTTQKTFWMVNNFFIQSKKALSPLLTPLLNKAKAVSTFLSQQKNKLSAFRKKVTARVAPYQHALSKRVVKAASTVEKKSKHVISLCRFSLQFWISQTRETASAIEKKIGTEKK